MTLQGAQSPPTQRPPELGKRRDIILPTRLTPDEHGGPAEGTD